MHAYMTLIALCSHITTGLRTRQQSHVAWSTLPSAPFDDALEMGSRMNGLRISLIMLGCLAAALGRAQDTPSRKWSAWRTDTVAGASCLKSVVRERSRTTHRGQVSETEYEVTSLDCCGNPVALNTWTKRNNGTGDRELRVRVKKLGDMCAMFE